MKARHNHRTAMGWTLRKGARFNPVDPYPSRVVHEEKDQTRVDPLISGGWILPDGKTYFTMPYWPGAHTHIAAQIVPNNPYGKYEPLFEAGAVRWGSAHGDEIEVESDRIEDAQRVLMAWGRFFPMFTVFFVDTRKDGKFSFAGRAPLRNFLSQRKNPSLRPPGRKELLTLRSDLSRAASRDTAYNAGRWKRSRPLSQHCGAVAQIVRRVYGGWLVGAKVKGERHIWNRLPCGLEVDLTSDQYGGDGLNPVARGRRIRSPASMSKRATTLLKRASR